MHPTRSAAFIRKDMSLRTILRMLGASCLLVSCFTTAALARKHTVMVVLTHGDDNVSIAPLLAKYAAEGHTVHYAFFTGPQDPAGEPGSAKREQVMCASRALGVRETFVSRNPAGELQQTIAAVAGRLIELIDQTKPDVIITWGPDGVTGHFRHIMVGGVVTRVFQQQGAAQAQAAQTLLHRLPGGAPARQAAALRRVKRRQ